MSESAALEASAKIMFTTLNTIFQLHDLTELEPDEGEKPIEACAHCSDLAEAIIHYPCPTVQVLTADMVVQPLEETSLLSDEAETSESTQPE
jgi:hypothetical protein